jgi:hypothetical protein
VSPQTALLTNILIACWDRYTESLTFVQKPALVVKRVLVKIIYFKEKPSIQHHLRKIEKINQYQNKTSHSFIEWFVLLLYSVAYYIGDD